MQYPSKPNGHSTRGSLIDNRTSPLSHAQRSRCAKPRTRNYVGTRPWSRHIDVNASALEAFLRKYANYFDGITPPDNSNLEPSICSESRLWTAEREEGNKNGFTSFASYMLDGSYQRSSKPSPKTLLRKNTTLDLITLIPPSAATPYLPQMDLVLELLDIYFLELPSAKLMFDQRSVVRRYRDATLPNQVLFAMLALASLYCQVPASAGDESPKAQVMNNVYKQGRVWAEIASQMALSKSDATSLTTVRTCEQTSLYWFAVGDRTRANFHADISYQTYRTMVRAPTRCEQLAKFDRAMWLHDCFSDYQKTYQDSTRFKLLCSMFDSWMKEQGLLPAGIALGFVRQKEWSDDLSLEKVMSTKYAVGAVGLWREVNSFAREFISSGKVVDIDLYALELKLHRFNNSLPNALKAQCRMDFQLAGPGQGAMLCFSIIHCANMICLHSTRTSDLMGLTRSSSDDSDASKHIITEMARIGGEIIHEHISTSPRDRRIPPMTGYCVFAIGAVHAHMHEFRDGPGWSEAWIHGVSCLLLLEHMSTYWPVLEKLCHCLRKRFSYSDPNMMTISNDLLWQLAGYPDTAPSPHTHELTTGFFSIPYAGSFVHEMLGLTENLKVHSNTESLDFGTSQPLPLTSSDGPMGMVGTHPPTFTFEANVLGLLQEVDP